tara:strand:+ start:13048 stop:14451 length:1404 start_codon:yes stop_codon:yes gene_type:complete
MIYTPISFKSFIERVSDVPLSSFKDVQHDKRFEIISIEGFGTQHLQKKNNKIDRLVFYKNNNPNLLKRTNKNVVTLIIKGRYSLGGIEGNVHIRLFEPAKPKKGKEVSVNHSSISCKFSFKNNDKVGALVKTDGQIKKCFDYVTDNLNKVLNKTPKSKHEISAMFVVEMSLISPNDGKLLAKDNALSHQKTQQLFKRIDEIVSSKGYSYDKVTNQKDGKKLGKKYFKPILENGTSNVSKTRPTFQISNRMNVQASGKFTIKELQKLLKMFVDAFNVASSDIILPTTLVPPPLHATTITHCRKNTPEMKPNGTCTGGRIPKVSNGNVCCYNELLYPGKAKKYVQEFSHLNIPLPKIYEKYKDSSWKVEKHKDEKTKKTEIRIVTKKGDNVIYKPWVCNKQTISDIRKYGKELLKLDMKGKKVDLCKRIEENLNPNPIMRKIPKKKATIPKVPIQNDPRLKKRGMKMRY